MVKQRKPRMGISVLGDLGADVMGVVWNLKKATVKDVFEVMYERRGLAYTTIMTVMNRLAIKGILSQDKTSVPYVYKPLVARDEMAISMVKEVVDRLQEGDTATLVAYLIDQFPLSSDEIGKIKTLLAEKSPKTAPKKK